MWFARWRWYHMLLAWLVFAAGSVLLVRSVFRVVLRAQKGVNTGLELLTFTGENCTL